MDYRAVLQISSSGMEAERLRLETAALNLANVNSSAPVGTAGYRPLRVVTHAVPFASVLDAERVGGPRVGVQAQVLPDGTATSRVVHDPGHPDADTSGNVRYPGVNHTSEMLAVMTALRAYEANVAVMSTARTMANRALDIGGQQ